MYRAIIETMHRSTPIFLLGICVVTLILHEQPVRAAEDPRLTPWIQALSHWGRGAGGEALYHALDAATRRLPQSLLRDALRA